MKHRIAEHKDMIYAIFAGLFVEKKGSKQKH